MTYRVTLKYNAIKALKQINEPYYASIKAAIYNLSKNPRPHGYRKLKDRAGYRIRVGDYRVVYTIYDSILTVEVIDLGHRKEIYG